MRVTDKMPPTLPPRPAGAGRRLWPYLALTLLTAAAAIPLLRSGVPCTDDRTFHLFKAVELGSLLDAGHVFPRWAPHMAQGYGYPFFNYFGPLSSYVVVAMHLAGLAYPTAVTAAFIVALWLSSVATFWLGRALWGQAGGLAAGAVYLFSPYLAYDILFRGNLAESFAFVWPPLVLLGLHRALAAPRPRPAWLLLVAACYAALTLTHNIFALLASPLFAALAALYSWQRRSWRVAAQGAVALGMGLALSAYFWFPALAERSLVQSDRLLVPPVFTWYTNFISLGELLALPSADDPLLINPSPQRAIGLIPALLCLPALWGAWRSRRGAGSAAGQVGFFLLAAACYGLLTLPVSTPIWQGIQLLELAQFPWRMLGPAAICVAMLAGASVHTLEAALANWRGPRSARRIVWLLVLAAIAVAYFANLPWWYARYCPAPATATVGDMLQFERDSFTIGTTAKGEFLPRTAPGVPPATDLADALIAGDEPIRLALPSGAGEIIAAEAADPLDASFQVSAARNLVAVYRQFYFPGWRVSLDGEPVEPRPVDAGTASAETWPSGDITGLLAFDLPAGTHSVRVYFGGTPLRSATAGVSLTALAAVTILAALAALKSRRSSLRNSGALPALSPHNPAFAWAVLALCALLPATRVLVIDRFDNPLRHSVFDLAPLPLNGPLGDYPQEVDFAGGIRLHGYDLSATRLRSGGSLDAALYVSRWMASEQRFLPAFRIEDATGLTWHQADQPPPRWHREPPPSPLWPLDNYAQWARQVSLLLGTPPGEYALTAEIFDLQSLAIASSLDAAGSNAAPRLTLAAIQVERPPQPLALAPPHQLDVAFGPLTLLGAGLSHTELNAGETMLVSLYWRSDALTTEDLEFQLDLGAGEAADALVRPPVPGFGTSQWQPGDQWLGQHPLRLPGALPSGDYDLSLSVPGGAGQTVLGRVRVTAPERSFVAPPMAAGSGAAWRDVAVLAGYTLSQTADALTLDLVWQPTATPAESYSVFVHLQSADGRVERQSDGVPADWTRPTTGWLPGEYVLDSRRLDLSGLPGGEFDLLVGLYATRTETRLAPSGPGAQPDARVLIAQITVP